jgi:hypothetical protein
MIITQPNRLQTANCKRRLTFASQNRTVNGVNSMIPLSLAATLLLTPYDMCCSTYSSRAREADPRGSLCTEESLVSTVLTLVSKGVLLLERTSYIVLPCTNYQGLCCVTRV